MELRYLTQNANSAHRARQRMAREGVNMKGQRLWTDRERQIVVKHYPDYDRLCRLLPGRTRCAISAAAAKLGLRKPIRVWTAAEISRLRKLYPSASIGDICAAFPWTGWTNIRQVARYHGFRRKQPGFKITGIPALDEVRRRCFEIGWSMPDLDKEARTKKYFTRAGWIGRRINHRAIGRAIEALDGVVKAQWN